MRRSRLARVAPGDLCSAFRRRTKRAMSVTESELSAVSVSVSNMTEHDLLEVVDIEQSCGLSRWGWDAYHAELQSGHRNLMLVARVKSSERTNTESVVRYLIARLAA